MPKPLLSLSPSLLTVWMRGVRSMPLRDSFFRPPYPFIRKRKGRCTHGPVHREEWAWPLQKFPELSPKYQQENPEILKDYTGCQLTGYTDANTGEFVEVPEMIPRLVVPDLTGFKLKPYVSFRTDVEIDKKRDRYAKLAADPSSDSKSLNEEQWPPPALSAKDLFNIHYAPQIKKDYEEGKYDHLFPTDFSDPVAKE